MPNYAHKVDKNKKKKGKSDLDDYNPLWLGKYTHEPMPKVQTILLMDYIRQLSDMGNHDIRIARLKADKDYEYIEIYIDGELLMDDYFIFQRKFFKEGKAFEFIPESDELLMVVRRSVALEKEIFGERANQSRFLKYLKIKEGFTNPDEEMDRKLKIACFNEELLVIENPTYDKEFKKLFERKYGHNPNILWDLPEESSSLEN